MENVRLVMNYTLRHTGIAGACFISIVLSIITATANATDREFGPPQFLGSTFSLPVGIAFDAPRNRVIVLTAGDHRIAYASLEDARSGAAWTIIGEVADRASADALNEPQGIATDAAGNIFVADTFNNQARLYRYHPDADTYSLDRSFTADTRVSVDGLPISLPRDIAVGADGAIYLLDSGNHRILRAANADARRFSVVHSGADWSYAYGLDVDGIGTLYVADTDNHRIVRIASGGIETAFGRYGRDRGALRYPKDVAIDPAGRIIVADTHNHRLAIFGADFAFYRSLGSAPLIRNPESLYVGPEGRIFIADIEREEVLGFFGPDVATQFDGYVRDNAADIGVPPTPVTMGYESPDVLVSISPDLDPLELAAVGLETMASEAVTPGGSYYLYFGVNNRGERPLPPGSLSIYTNREDTSEPLYAFPDEWHRDETFRIDRGVVSAVPENLLMLPEVPPSTAGTDGRIVVGPLQWRPAGTTESCDSRQFVMSRLVNLHDPMIYETDNGLEQALASNNIGVRAIPFVASDCIPEPDRYEPNDSAARAARVVEPWDHLHEVCPRWLVRGSGTYPEARSCEDIFEDGFAPRAAEELWTLRILDLSLHSGLDRDFFNVTLPDFTDPSYQVDDINTQSVRERFGDLPSYEPVPMPECGAVQRVDPGPAGADRRVYINVSTELVLEVTPEGPPENSITPRPVDLMGEELFIYTREADGFTRDATISVGGRYVKRIVCPKELHELDDIVFSFGERAEPVTARELASTGGYRIDAAYVSSIDRGVPPWAEDPGVTGRLDCFGLRPIRFGGASGGFSAALPSFAGSFAGARFPFCGFDLFGPSGFFERHPRVPVPDCIADGPGCFSQFYFYWPGRDIPLSFSFLAGKPLLITLVNSVGTSIAETELSANVPPGQLPVFENADLSDWAHGENETAPNTLLGAELYASDLEPGYYAIKIEGSPTVFAFGFRSLSFENRELDAGQRKLP